MDPSPHGAARSMVCRWGRGPRAQRSLATRFPVLLADIAIEWIGRMGSLGMNPRERKVRELYATLGPTPAPEVLAMFGRLLPKEGRFFDLFNAHAAQIVRAAHELREIMRSYEDREQHARIIDEAEHAADRITAETIRLLHKTFITPLDRDHIHRLVTAMDDVVDLIQDATESLSLYDIRAITPETARLADIAVKCCERVKDVV